MAANARDFEILDAGLDVLVNESKRLISPLRRIGLNAAADKIEPAIKVLEDDLVPIFAIQEELKIA